MKKLYITLVRFVLNIFDSFQQKKIISFFKKRLKNKIIFFDVGSHYGETIKLFDKYFDIKKFHCFEASPINYKILKKKAFDIKDPNKIVLNNIGLGKEVSNTYINQTQESSSSTINELNEDSIYFNKKLKVLSINDKKKYFTKIPIKVISLDHYIKKIQISKIDVLKIDTEGYEFEVLSGLKDNFNKISYIYFEHHFDDMIKKNYTFRDINNLLKKNRFKLIFKSKMIFRKSFEYIFESTTK